MQVQKTQRVPIKRNPKRPTARHIIVKMTNFILFFKDFIHFCFRQRKGREKERERNTNVRLLLPQPPPGTQPVTQACTLTRNQTINPVVHRLVLSPLSHKSQGKMPNFKYKERLLKATREKQEVTYKGAPIKQLISQQKHYTPEGNGKKYSK